MKLTARQSMAKAKAEDVDFQNDMKLVGILCHIIKTTYDRSQETESLAKVRAIKSKWGDRYLPS